MRSSFGDFAVALRQRLGMSQTEFSFEIGESLARVSNLEHYRTNIGKDVLERYTRVLQCSEQEAEMLREHAEHSNSVRRLRAKDEPLEDIQALLSNYGHQLSERAKTAIRRAIEEDIGTTVAHLRLQNARHLSASILGGSRRKVRVMRPELSIQRFTEVVLQAEQVRKRHVSDKDRLHIGKFLDAECLENPALDLDIVDVMPLFAQGAYAVIMGHHAGHTIVVREEMYRGAQKGVKFWRHAIMHEFSHHKLHPNLLESENECFLAPYLPDENAVAVVKREEASESGNYEAIDTLVEAEAELFSTMTLVPWIEFVRRPDGRYLSDDFGEEQRHIAFFGKYFRNPRLIHELKLRLWNTGYRDHPIFAMTD